MVSDEDKTMGMLSHLLGIFSGFIAPLVIFLTFKDMKHKQFVRDNARNALNFQISMLIYYFACFVLMISLMMVLIGFLFIPIIWGLGIFALIVEIIGCVRARGGEVYKYPLTIPFIA